MVTDRQADRRTHTQTITIHCVVGFVRARFKLLLAVADHLLRLVKSLTKMVDQLFADIKLKSRAIIFYYA